MGNSFGKGSAKLDKEGLVVTKRGKKIKLFDEIQANFPKKHEKNQLLVVLDSLPESEEEEKSPRHRERDNQLGRANTPTTFSSSSDSPVSEPHVVSRKDLSALKAAFGVLD